MHGLFLREKEEKIGTAPIIFVLEGDNRMWNFAFFAENILLGVGLAMDAFAVSMANGLQEPGMKKRKMLGMAGVFGLFQMLMPLVGWLCVHTLVEAFTKFEPFVPWIAFALLAYIGGKMIFEGAHGEDEPGKAAVGIWALLVQGVATSIDALSVGFTIAEYDFLQAFVAALLIGVVTSVICVAGVKLGRKFGVALAGKANILGGVILIAIGLEILITGLI